jgi:O-antigen/teichoic acid export membrane protein
VRPGGQGVAVLRRFGWGMGDQALSSLTNFAVGIAVARSVSASAFGAFALAFSFYSIALSVSRAVSTDPMMVRFSAATRHEQRGAARDASGAALTVGAVLGIAVCGAAMLIPAGYRNLLLALGAVLPGLLLQDAWRSVAICQGRPFRAFANDLVWALCLPVTFGGVWIRGSASAASLVLAWGVAGSAAALFGVWQQRQWPRLTQAWRWVRRHRDLSGRYLLESVLLTGTMQLYFFAIGSLAGLAAVGQIKLVQVVLGPVNVLVQGVGLVAVPEAARALQRGRRQLDRVLLGISGVVGGGALAWGLVVWALPDAWATGLTGPGWSSASGLVVPLSLLQVLNGANTGAFVGLRALGAARRSLWVRVATSVAFTAGAVAGAVASGAAGASWGLAAAAAVNLVLWRVGYAWEWRRRERQSSREPDAAAHVRQNATDDAVRR